MYNYKMLSLYIRPRLHPYITPSIVTPTRTLLYKRTTKIKRTPTPDLNLNAKLDDPLADNKYYKRTPNILRPHMRSMLLHPGKFVLSVAVLQQIFTIVPFLFLWKGYYNGWFHVPFEMPEQLIEHARGMMEKGLTQWDPQMGDRDTAIETGATAYATVRALTPLIWVSAILGAPFFEVRARALFNKLLKFFKRNNNKKQ